jgi:hypothetical protein
VPFLLADGETICYLVEADYTGEGTVQYYYTPYTALTDYTGEALAAERHIAIFVDVLGQGVLKPAGDTLAAAADDCGWQARACERYKGSGEECKQCFESLHKLHQQATRCEHESNKLCGQAKGGGAEVGEGEEGEGEEGPGDDGEL